MDQEMLERLMLDDSLGALSDDIRTLLADRIGPTGSPAAAQAAAYRRTIDDARAAMVQPSGAALPPFPAARLRREALTIRRRRAAGRIAALAACLVIGLGLGRLVFGRADVAAPAPAAITVAQVAAPAAPAPQAVTEFWSSSRLAARALAAQPETSLKVTWFSPVQQPRIGG